MSRLDRVFQGGLYRSRDGVILGVCRGIAEYFDFSVFWTRAIAIVLLFFTGFWPITILYLISALLMKPRPVIPIETEDHQEFYDSYIHSRGHAADRLKRRYEHLERRLRRLEDLVTTREFDWDSRLNAE